MFLVPLPANAVSPVKVKVMLKTSSVVEKRQKREFTLSKSRSAMLSTPVSPSRKGTCVHETKYSAGANYVPERAEGAFIFCKARL